MDPRLKEVPGPLNTPCWVWLLSTDEKGYGWIRVGPRMERAHRYFFGLDLIPRGFGVLHHCDNPPCCRREHLFLGTNADNTADKIAKGRARYATPCGEASPKARLTEAAVRSIRAAAVDGEQQRDIARRFGVAQPTISDVITRRSWAHVH